MAQRHDDGGEPRREVLPGLLGYATTLVGLVTIFSALTPEVPARLKAVTAVLPLQVAHLASAAVAVVGVLLVALGHGLRRRKRRAWRATVLLLVLSAALHIAKGLDAEEAVAGLALGAALVWQRDKYYAAGDPRARLRAPAVLASMVLVSLVLGLGLLWFSRHHITGGWSLSAEFEQVLWGMVGLTGPVHFRDSVAADRIADVLLGLGATTALVTVYLMLRPPEPRCQLSAEDEARLRALLRGRDASDSLGYFSLRRDKSVVFSESGKAAVSYRVVSGVMLAAGDPIGDPEAWPGAVKAFLAEARRHAWVPAVIGCSERAGQVWARVAGLRAMEIGDEAVLDVETFSLDGRAMRNVRQTVRRVERAGYVTQARRLSELTDAEISDIRRQAASWRGAEVERGFSMALGRFGDRSDDECLVVTATKDDKLAAVLHFVPWGPDGLSLDLMRRDRGADTGLNELMIVATLRAAPGLGVRKLSLNFAVFRAALDRGSRLGAGPVLRAWRGLLLVASRWFQIESLFRFNAKFEPLWWPRFVCYPAGRDLPRIVIAALEAEAFIVWPTQLRQLRKARRLAVAT